MAKKRKTLPKNFNELIETGDLEAIKEVFEKCELDARGGYGKGTALGFFGISEEMVRWLAEQGADINAVDTYGRTPLHRQAMWKNKDVQVLLELGADKEAADNYGNTPLHTAAGCHNVSCVKKLIAYQANIDVKNKQGETPLFYGLAQTQNIYIADMAAIADLLIDMGAEVTQSMSKLVIRIGENFEFHREAFNKDYLQETDAGLMHLYYIFGITPVKKRQMHDGISSIIPAAGTWQEQYSELWDLLIPSSGAAKTVQGEVIRITGRVRDEIFRNGGANWDKDYRRMLDALIVHFASGIPLEDAARKEAEEITVYIRKTGDADEEPSRLCELAVQWVLKNPKAVLLEKTNYCR